MRVAAVPQYRYFDVCVALFVTTLIVSNIASVKLVSTGSLLFDAGTILFPLAYILGDVITEVYGFRRMRRVLGLGLGMLLLTTLTLWAVQVLPPAEEWGNQAAYESILGVVWRIIAASMSALLLGELLNAYVLAKLKIRTKGTQLWSRLIGSSAVGSLVDTVVFSVIAFAGTVSAGSLISLICTVYALKLAAEVVLSPVTMRIIGWLKQRERLDTFEEPHLW